MDVAPAQGRSKRARWVRPVAGTGFLILFLILLDSRLGPLPPLARFFSPFHGFWRNAESVRESDESSTVPGLIEAVTVVYDKRHVPHIFAQNAHDLFLAQGYVTARDRLWQMEIQVRAGAGRLAEILGPGMIEHDRFQRRLGIPQAAERSLERIAKDEDSWSAMRAYAEGVNAWIDQLDPEDYPLEYKLLDYAPSRWTAVNTALLLKNMQWTLSGGGDDLPMSNTLAKLGRDFTVRFFPYQTPGTPPVIPPGTVWDTAAPAPAASHADTASHLPPALMPLDAAPGVPQAAPSPGNGSNNFVVSGAHTASGHPILANDPHLDQGLPSLWYEIQLSAPGISSYGVSLPGAPAVIIGYNRKIAWGITNGTDDFLDWYRITFRDATLSEYQYGGQWKPTRKELQIIKVRGGADVLDTVVYTHQGPVVRKDQEKPFTDNTPALHALRWVALEPSDELLAFIRLMKAGDYASFYAALETFHCPSQNFAFASVDGDIAMIHHGLFPRKWKGQGRYTMDGSEPGNDWSGWLPRRMDPASHNPARGWLASANQQPADSTYPFYLGAGYINGPRARRLGQLVSEAESLTVDGAFALLQDQYDRTAADLLPALLPGISAVTLSREDSAARKELAAWDFRHAPDSHAAALFDQWWRILYNAVWSDEFGGDMEHYQWPSKDRTRRLILEEPDAEWFDDIRTPARETLPILALRSFRDACAHLRRWPGGMPAWSAYRGVNLRHLARIDAFSDLGIATGGCGDCVNAQRDSHGPSWRMVVDLSQQPKGYGIYPGGQSGNPGSPHYDDFVPDWAAGRHNRLTWYADPGAGGDAPAFRLRMRGR